MSAWTGSITRRAYHFEPLNAKKLERPSPRNQAAHEGPKDRAVSSARGSRGIADPPDSESGSLGRASRLAPTTSKTIGDLVSQ